MGTSPLLHLMLWLCVAAQSSLQCDCAPTFRRETIHHEVIPALQDPDAVASTEHALVQALDGDVVTEKDHQALDGDVVTEKDHQASGGDVVTEMVRQATDIDVVPEINGPVDDNPVFVAKQVKQPEAKIHFQLLGKDSANLNYGDIWGPAQSHDLSQEKRIESAEALTYSGRFLLRLRFLLNMFYVWAIMCSVAAVQFLLLFAYHKSKGHIVKKHYVVNRV